MIGIDSATGRYLHGNEHLRQSVTDILSTPVGSRVLLREYGSRLFSLLDNPQDDFTRVRIVRETVLKSLDFSQVTDESSYNAIEWPVPPQNT